MHASFVSSRRGSTLVLSLTCIALLAIAAAYTLQRITPRFQMAAQAAAWQEARLSAEAGVDVALVELERNALGFNEGSWSGWQQYERAAPPPLLDGLLRPVTSLLPSIPLVGGTLAPAVGTTLASVNNLLGLLGNSVEVTGPIFLDDLQIAAAGNRETNVDVQLWAVYPTPSPYYRWFRLRSMATVALPPLATQSHETTEGHLRRFSLREVRPQLRENDVGTPMDVPTPHSSRIIEVLVEPLLPFELAVLTDRSLRLGTSGSWLLDSYDSRDPEKSADGLYPGKDSPRVQDNANIASNAARPADAPYGPLISANGARVRGGIGTNGGDDPKTESRESVAGATRVNPDRVRDDFYRELRPLARPSRGIFRTPPAPGQAFAPGSVAQPAKYLITKNLGGFSVAPAPAGSEGAAIIMVNGDLVIPDGTIRIAPNVSVQLFVRGNVDFYNRPINAGGRAAQLQIYGEDAGRETRSLRAFGKASITAAFYGPHYEVRLMDEVEWFGAVAARSFEMIGGGSGGFHYDEALGMIGAPIGFRIARYVEDVRE